MIIPFWQQPPLLAEKGDALSKHSMFTYGRAVQTSIRQKPAKKLLAVGKITNDPEPLEYITGAN